MEIGNGIKEIPTEAFLCVKSIESVTIGANVQTIADYAFSSYYNTWPHKVIWQTNTPPNGYYNARGRINYVSNDLYSELDSPYKINVSSV